ncbi:hypothetical protein NQ176_g2764 [Zarea fungicola]|uniref:Uncharacterized protein n=1 Tax=Zarea fungicola TaxID=93591 RepID=A0ACC1NLT5_9HYPO|nr:hypothetical protein NQ176_g2764 [Lecanicillium fungicola]
MALPFKPFQYCGLPANDSIRVVTLLPGAFTDPIRCEISCHNTQSLPQYEALSYTWGDPTDTTQTTIDGCLLRVTANLERALRHLRKSQCSRSLWVDAICINQQDDAEKELQVQAMASIYQRSSRVLIWLGEEIDPLIHLHLPPPLPISDVFDGIAQIAAGQGIDHLINGNPWLQWTPAILDLLGRPWFTRLWVVQETALTLDPLLICGWESLPWTTLLKAYRGLRPTLGPTANGAALLEDALQNLDALVICWAMMLNWDADQTPATHEKVCRRLLILLFTLKGKFICSDERDRLNGMLGMLGDPKLLKGVSLGYRSSAATVFQSIAVFMLESLQSLDFLIGDRTNFDAANYPGKPSWVPTWKSYSAFTRGIFLAPSIFDIYAGVGDGRGSSPCAEYCLSDDQNILYLRGCIIGTPVGMGTPPPYAPQHSPVVAQGSDEYRKALKQLLIMWEIEVVHFPIMGARGQDEELQKARAEMKELWNSGIIPLPSLAASCKTEKESINYFRKTLFHSDKGGPRHPEFTTEQIYETLIGRNDIQGAKSKELSFEVDRFAHFQWRNLYDMAPFRLSEGHFGILELGMELYGPDTVIALFSGGVGPVVLLREGGYYRYMGSCYVQGLEDETSRQLFLEQRDVVEFALT